MKGHVLKVLKNDGHSVGMDFSEGVDYHFPYFGLRVGQTIPTLSGGSYSHILSVLFKLLYLSELLHWFFDHSYYFL